jgi:hypothetical protein
VALHLAVGSIGDGAPPILAFATTARRARAAACTSDLGDATIVKAGEVWAVCGVMARRAARRPAVALRPTSSVANRRRVWRRAAVHVHARRYGARAGDLARACWIRLSVRRDEELAALADDARAVSAAVKAETTLERERRAQTTRGARAI